ncbi:hypothetical protein FIBSPDRAFT_984845 [Athelia psychrophila]|uniref:Uncharacterized protein n=1 Tax=Athelia psychrophila TaxID=1759441 RepID=A0A166BCQ8_9AGAM|nr:hypothetical protein FIBSPDRAFT_984845 [Fibularhizoctonia sp. CBS 109695]
MVANDSAAWFHQTALRNHKGYIRQREYIPQQIVPKGSDPFYPNLAAIPVAYPLVYDLPAPNGCGNCIEPRCSDHDLNLYLDPILLHPPPPMVAVISSFAPTDADKHSVRISMDCLRHQKRQVAARLQYLMWPTHVDEHLALSRSRCDEADSQIDASFAAYANILAPIRTLTPDDLLAIFTAYVDQAGSHVLRDLSLVCKQWQEMARTTHLWTNIAVLININYPVTFLIAAKFVATCDSRSGMHLLRFRLEVDYEPLDVGPRPAYLKNLGILANHHDFRVLADAISDTAPRWLDATLVGSPAFLLVLARVVAQGSRWWESLPMLDRLTMDVRVREEEESELSSKLAPSLLFKNGRSTDPGGSPLDEDNACLVAHQHECAESALGVPQLMACKAIVTADMYGEGPMDLRHNFLQTLDLHISGPGAFESFFQHCELPSLVNLRLYSDEHWPGIWSQYAVHLFLWRSSCRLETLVLDFAGLNTHDLLALLGLVTTLSELHIIDRPSQNLPPNSIIGNVLMERLTIFSPPLLPNLRVLKLGGILAFDPQPFSAMAESRFAANQYLYPKGCVTLWSLVVYPSVPPAGIYASWRTARDLRLVNEHLGNQIDIQPTEY